jgi:hypothetical protein
LGLIWVRSPGQNRVFDSARAENGFDSHLFFHYAGSVVVWYCCNRSRRVGSHAARSWLGKRARRQGEEATGDRQPGHRRSDKRGGAGEGGALPNFNRTYAKVKGDWRLAIGDWRLAIGDLGQESHGATKLRSHGATKGRGKTSKRRNVKTSKRRNVKTSKRQNVETGAEIHRRRETEARERQRGLRLCLSPVELLLVGRPRRGLPANTGRDIRCGVHDARARSLSRSRPPGRRPDGRGREKGPPRQAGCRGCTEPTCGFAVAPWSFSRSPTQATSNG